MDYDSESTILSTTDDDYNETYYEQHGQNFIVDLIKEYKGYDIPTQEMTIILYHIIVERKPHMFNDDTGFYESASTAFWKNYGTNGTQEDVDKIVRQVKSSF